VRAGDGDAEDLHAHPRIVVSTERLLMNQPSSNPPQSDDPLLELRSLGTVAAALVQCRHPHDCRVTVHVVNPSAAPPERVQWCALCGAFHSGPAGAKPWQSPALLSLLARPQFGELSLLLHALRHCSDLHAKLPVGRAASEQMLRDVLAALAALATTHLARDLDRLDDAIADMRADVTPHDLLLP
jgi:hypothetical protein